MVFSRSFLGVPVDFGGDPVRGEDDRRTLGYLVELVDEDRAPALEPVDDVLVVNDLLADVDRSPVQVESLLDRDDRAVDTRAVPPRSRKQHGPVGN